MQNSEVALCLFGSLARGTTDTDSDKDLLVVCDELSMIPNDVQMAWREEGWTTAHYTWRGLSRRAERGDLLLQHLKQEGVILDDRNGHLRKILDDFSPRADYFDEVRRAIIMLRPADRRGGPLWQQQFLCGLIYEFARHAILHMLASQQVYIFDYAQGVEKLSKTSGLLSADDSDALISLRALRSQYETRSLPKEDPSQTLDRAREIATKLFGFDFLVIPADAEVRLLKGYSTIRDIEARILAHHSPLVLDSGDLLPDIWKLVQRPKAFRWAANGQVDQEALRSINVALSASFEGSK